jgi:hypothetical protein
VVLAGFEEWFVLLGLWVRIDSLVWGCASCFYFPINKINCCRADRVVDVTWTVLQLEARGERLVVAGAAEETCRFSA